eukprot:9502900-Pyramimonas_sp.AAC.1
MSPPGSTWKVQPSMGMIEDPRLTTMRMRLCHTGFTYSRRDAKPSCSHRQVVTAYSRIPTTMGRCKCVDPTRCALDCCGRDQQRAGWRLQDATCQ